MEPGPNSLQLNPSRPGASRRTFLKRTAYLTLGSVAVGRSLAAVITEKGSVAFVVAPDDTLATAVAPTWALGELRAALQRQGVSVRVVARIADAAENEFCVIPSGMNARLAKKIMDQQKLSAPTEAESLCLAQSELESRPVLLAAGTDAEMSPAGSLIDTGTGVLIGNGKFTRYGYADTLAENRTWATNPMKSSRWCTC